MKELGLTALGHCIKFTDFFTKKKYEMTNDDDRKEKLEKLRSLIGTSSQSRSRKGKTPSQSTAPTTKKQRVKENLRFKFGWKYWTSGRFQQKKMDHGGGNRSWDVPRYASLEDCLEIVKGLFFPNGKTPVGDISSMSLALANYSGEVINDSLEDDEVCKIRADIYKTVTGLNHPRLHLVSKPVDDSDTNISEDELHRPTFDNSISPLSSLASLTNNSYRDYVASEESYRKLNAKRKEESENPQETLYIILSRHETLMSFYVCTKTSR